MKINEVEAAVGVTKKNIRFYEEEGLIHPGREPGNGYRSYSAADVERLRRIKLLRKLDVPLAEIRQMLEGECTLYVADGVGDALGQISTVVMEKRKMYNIKKGVWHNLAGNEQMVLLIVENADTSKGNSDFFPVTADMLP